MDRKMKYCKHKTLEEPRKDFIAVYHYVTIDDIEKFHGKPFKDQFITFISENIKPSWFDKEEGYYLIDYQFYAQRTKMWLESE